LVFSTAFLNRLILGAIMYRQWKGSLMSELFAANRTGKEHDCVLIRFTADLVAMPVGRPV